MRKSQQSRLLFLSAEMFQKPLFASILNLSVMLGNYLQQTTSADDIFRCPFFLGALRVNPFTPNGISHDSHQLDQSISVLKVVGASFNLFSIFNRTFCKQTVVILIRCRVLLHLIWVCTDCLCHTKRKLGVYGLNARNNKANVKIQLWALTRENLSSGFRTE